MLTVFRILIVLFSMTSTVFAEVADLVVFSYDRPMQLYAFLESVEKHVQGVETHIIYRTTNAQFDAGYEIVQQRFANAIFHKQGINPRADFKPLTMQVTFEGTNNYVVFAVDDIIVKEDINIAECIDLLKEFSAYGFYLRVGKSLKERRPPFIHINPQVPGLSQQVHMWQFNRAVPYRTWGYPNTVDMTVYKKQDIFHDLQSMDFSSPNTLESIWAGRADFKLYGLCYETTKIINIPLNLVQNDFQNANMNYLSSKELLDLFFTGLKIDIHPFFRIANEMPHMNYIPTFIMRE